MNPLVSVIIPTKNSERTLRACLQSISDQSYDSIECIVVDNNSSDSTQTIAKAAHVKVITAGNERSAQRNVGAAHSKGDFLIFIDSDMELANNVIAECVEIANSKSAIHAIVIPEESFGTTFWAQCKQFERSCYLNTPWLLAARFFRRSSFEEVGPFNERIIGGEDFELHARIVRRFHLSAIGYAKSMIRHNEGALQLHTLLQKKYYYGKTIATYKKNTPLEYSFSFQANLLSRIWLFLRNPRTLLHHPLIVMGTCMMKWLEFCALAMGHLTHNTRQ